MLVDSEYRRFSRKHPAEVAEPLGTHVAMASVEHGPALSIVPVRDHRQVEPDILEKIEPGKPAKILPDLVNRINWE
jgi:hypothetical protein